MEKYFFTWDGWDIMDTMDFMFYKVTLVRDIGKFKTGQFLEYATIDYGNGLMTLSEDIDWYSYPVFQSDFC